MKKLISFVCGALAAVFVFSAVSCATLQQDVYTYTEENSYIFSSIEVYEDRFIKIDAEAQLQSAAPLEKINALLTDIASYKSSTNVIPTKWIKTSTPPSVLVINTANDNVLVEKRLVFTEDTTNPVWYYPLTENLQPFALTETGNNEYTTALVVSDNNIGYPMYWFTCDNSNIGPNVSITDPSNINNNDDVIIYFGARGNDSKYNVLGYVGIDGNNDATPSCDTTSHFSILVHPKRPNAVFSGDIISDRRMDLSRNIVFKDTTNQTEYTIPIVLSSDDGSTITMNTDDVAWTYIDTTTYSISMDVFDGNCVNVATSINTLIPFIKIHLDESVLFDVDDTDYGTAGIFMSSMNPHDDIQEGYPFDACNVCNS